VFCCATVCLTLTACSDGSDRNVVSTDTIDGGAGADYCAGESLTNCSP
jgi:hypothetical protein